MKAVHKVQTYLHNYRYNSFIQKAPILVTWWVLNENEDDARPFADHEEKEFLDFVVKHTENFREGGKNVLIANEGDAPSIDDYDFLPSPSGFPAKLILAKRPQRNSAEVPTVVYIVLEPSHIYSLSFDVIGEIEQIG